MWDAGRLGKQKYKLRFEKWPLVCDNFEYFLAAAAAAAGSQQYDGFVFHA